MALTLAVGYYFSKKTRTFREYAVGNKQFATAALVATVLATNYGGGGLLRTVEQVPNLGLYWIVVIVLDTFFAFWLISCLATRIGTFLQHLSMAETLGSVYGSGPRIATALSGFGVSIGFLAIQINSIASTIRACFDILLNLSILLVGLFVFAGVPDVTIPQVWPYIMNHVSDFFKGLVSVSVLAMTLSTADSCLNTCSVLISHDIFGSIPSKQMAPYVHRIEFARLVSLSVGLCAMLLAFFQKDLWELLRLTFAFSVPIVTAPLLLALYGLRSGSRTALIGMGTGAFAILVWNAWIKPRTDIDGEFPCMLLNGLAMLIAHYRMDQPEGSGWVEMDATYWRIRHTQRNGALRGLW